MKRFRFLVFGALSAVTFASVDAEARAFRHEQVPNGERFQDCTLCHVNANGGARNSFGLAIQNMGLSGVGNLADQDVVWANVCELDSDNDGYTNGVELGDPNCEWMIGDANPAFAPTNPGNTGNTPCGNGTIEANEMCDGSNLNNTTCVDLNQPDGRLSCNFDCTFNTTQCVVAPVNNQNPPNNEPGTNNEPGNNEPGNNQPGNNQPGNNDPGNNEPGTNNGTNGESPEEPRQQGDLEPFFCDGEMSVEGEEPAPAGILIFLFGLLGLRRLMS